MQEAIVTVPKAALYESISLKNHCLAGENVSDELLSGWTIHVQDCQRNFLKITTQYGYSGWLNISDVRKLPRLESSIWNNSQSSLLLTQRLTDVLASPKVQAPVLSTLFMGSLVSPYGCPHDGWQKIQLASGSFGYVPSIAVSAQPVSDLNVPDNLRSSILDYALSYLGTQYRWGGKTHEGIDCSGLAFMSYYMCGIFIYRDAVIQPGYPVKKIPFSQIKPADLLYFPGHVALYLGNSKYIHSTGNLKSFGCVINSLNPRDQDYHADLAKCFYAAGSVFC